MLNINKMDEQMNDTKKFRYFPLASISATPTTALVDIITMPFRGTYHIFRKCKKPQLN